MWKSANSESVTGPDGTEYGAQVKRDERDVSGVRLAAGTARHGSSARPSATASARSGRNDGEEGKVIVSGSGRPSV